MNKKEKAGNLICKHAKQIYVGDQFLVPKHSNQCCNHIVKCEVLKNKKCSSGYGLHSLETGELIANAGIATYRVCNDFNFN